MVLICIYTNNYKYLVDKKLFIYLVAPLVAPSIKHGSAKMSIGDRIKEVRDNVSRDAFAPPLGVTRNSIQRYETNERKPGANFIESICKAYKINADWLIFGKGPKYTDQLPVAEVDQDTLIAVISSLEEALEANNKKMEPDKKAEVIAMLYEIITEEERRGEGVATLGRLIKLAV
jgi:transcriptional regulator with XRE-family HTH domain